MKRGIQIIFTCALFFISLCASAQIGPPPPTEGAPIDGGAVAFLIVTVAFGYWMLKRKKKVEVG